MSFHYKYLRKTVATRKFRERNVFFSVADEILKKKKKKPLLDDYSMANYS